MITPITLIVTTVAAAAAGYGIGVGTRRNLDLLGYRRSDERDLPIPAPRRWVPWVTAAATATLPAVAAANASPVLILPFLPLALAGPWLAAVDLDVNRLPNRVSGLVAAAILVTVGLVTVVAGKPSVALSALLGGLLAGAVFLASHLLTRGGIGMGDVKLAAAAGLAIGAYNLTLVLAAVLIGSLAAIAWAKATRHSGPLAYGPWLLLGAWTAAALTVFLP